MYLTCPRNCCSSISLVCIRLHTSPYTAESPESLIRYRLLSEPEIVNLLTSAPSGSSEEQQAHNHSTVDRCSGNSYDAGSSSLSDGSPTTGVDHNGASSLASAGTTTTASSSPPSGSAQSPPVVIGKDVTVEDDAMNRTNQTSATSQSNMLEV